MAHGRRRRAEQERGQLLEDVDAERRLNTKLRVDLKVLTAQMEAERQQGRDAREQELVAEKNQQWLRAEGFKRQLGLRTKELTGALSSLEKMKDTVLYK